MRSRPSLCALPLLCVLSLLVLGQTGPCASSAPDPIVPDDSTPAPGGPQLVQRDCAAAETADRLLTAGNAGALGAVLHDLYGQLGVGLYTAGGSRVIGGAETGADDFYLYEFERDLMAKGMLEGRRYTVTEIARFLEEAGVVDGNTSLPPSGTHLMMAIADAIQRARADANPAGCGYRIIDGLALARGVDLGESALDPDATTLDAVQYFIVLYDVLGGVDAGAGGADKSARADQSACDFNEGNPMGAVRWAGFQIGGKLFKWVSIVGVTLDSIHDGLIAIGYQLKLEPKTSLVHWQHGSGENNKVQLAATVDFDLGRANEKIQCGKLFGFETPKNGTAPDLTVIWEADAVLKKNGTLDDSHEMGGISSTNQFGVAYAEYTPKTEKNPGVGARIEESGTVTARLVFRSIINPRIVFSLLGVGPEFHTEVAQIRVESHKSWRLDIEGQFKSEGYQQTFNRTSIPLRMTDPQTGVYEGDGVLTTDDEVTSGECTILTDTSNSMRVRAAGFYSLDFQIDTSAHQESMVICPDNAQTITKDFAWKTINFTLPLEDGQTYKWPGAGYGYTGTLNFTLREDSADEGA